MKLVTKYVGAVFVVLMFLFTTCLTASAVNVKDNLVKINDDHNDPDMNVKTTPGTVTWARNGMNAHFVASAKSYHPEDKGCRLVVKVWNEGDESNSDSGYSDCSIDYFDKSVTIRLDPDKYKEGDRPKYEMWIEDASDLQSTHKTGDFYIKPNDAKALTMNQLMNNLLSLRLPILERLLNLF